MKNKIILLGITLLFILSKYQDVLAQNIQSTSQNGYIPVRTYAGVTNLNTFGYLIHIYGPNVNVSNWSLGVRVNGAIQNGEGKILDPRRLKIRINNISQSINYVSQPITLDQIGTNNTPVPLSQNEVTIFRNSRFPLATASDLHYKSIFISFDIIVEGGSYLEALKSWNEYFLNVIFSTRNMQGALLTEAPAFVRMQIHPDDAPPSGPSYSLQVNGNASAGVLEFLSPQDFATGIARTYSSGLSVISSTPYQLQVRTLTSDFVANNNSVPVNTVRLQLKTVGAVKQGTITLSNINQTVINNETSTGSQARLYDIRYFTQPNDTRLLKAVPANYQATVMYTLMPQ